MSLASSLSFTALVLSAIYAGYVMYGMRRLAHLKDQRVEHDGLPSLSVVVAALNEAETIEPAMRSLLHSGYPRLEVIAVNDRSSDATGTILARLATEDSRLKVLHVDVLPTGWLGKTHALQQGADLARGEYLLFTDADVMFAPGALQRAVHYARRQQIDHLAVMPELQAEGDLLRMMLLQFGAAFFMRYRPWRVRRKKGVYVGIGAFNLVRRACYRDSGGHDNLALEPLDDIMLGRQLKLAGARADVLLGDGCVRVSWYPGVSAMVRAFWKNAYAGFDYSLVKLAAGSLIVALIGLWPAVGLFVGEPAGRLASALAITMQFRLFDDMLRRTLWSRRSLLYAIPATLLSLYMWWRGSLLTVVRGEIDWRGTRYSLRALKAARMR